MAIFQPKEETVLNHSVVQVHQSGEKKFSEVWKEEWEPCTAWGGGGEGGGR